MINHYQFRNDVVKPALKAVGMYSFAAEQLMVGTAAVESNLHFLRQWPSGPALGLFQMESATYQWLVGEYLDRKPEIRAKFLRLTTTGDRFPDPEEMIWNMRFAAAMCRLRYWVVPEALPDGDDVMALGEYWKTHYNTISGAGTAAKFFNAFPKVEAY